MVLESPLPLWSGPSPARGGGLPGDSQDRQNELLQEWFLKKFQLSSNRQERYRIFYDMDQFDLVQAVMDVYAEECTQKDYDKGRTVWIESKHTHMIEAGDSCLKNVLMEDRAFAIVRRCCLLGDNFRRTIYQAGKGVLGWKFADPAKVHRVEDKFDRLLGFREDGKTFRGARKYRLSWPWDYVHYRLMGKDDESQYGSSAVAPLFRCWRQLCEIGSSIVWTVEGPIEIRNLKKGDSVYCHDAASGETRVTKVAALLAMGMRGVIRVQTQHRQIVLTPDHGLLVKTPKGEFCYKKAKDLAVSPAPGYSYKADRLVLPRVIDGEDTYEIQMNSDNYVRVDGNIFWKGRAHRSVKPTKHLDADFRFTAGVQFARMFGFMLGDGWLTKSRMRVGFALKMDERTNRKYIRLFRELFSVRKYQRTDAVPNRGGQVNFHSSALVDLFHAAGFITGFQNKRVPPWMFGMSREFKRELIRGLMDADGSRQGNGWRLSLSNKVLMQQVVMVCQQSGFKLSRNIEEISRPERQLAYRVYVSDGPTDDPVVYEAVTHVDAMGEDETYDLQVEDDVHNFVSEGVVSKNTMAEDADIMYQLRKAGDRTLVMLDVGNSDDVEAVERMHRFENTLKKKVYVDPASPEYVKNYNPATPIEDIVIPIRGAEDATRVEPMSGATTALAPERLDYYRRKFTGTSKVPGSFLGWESDTDAKATLMVQDCRFARTMKRVQRAFIQGTRNLLDMHYTLMSTDDREFDPNKMHYLVAMSPISYLDEYERLELVQLRYSVIDAMAMLGQSLQMNSRAWSMYLLIHYAKLPEDVVRILTRRNDTMGDPTMPPPGGNGAPPPGSNPAERYAPGDPRRTMLNERYDRTVKLSERIKKVMPRDDGGKWSDGLCNFTEAEMKKVAQAVHRSPLLRQIIGEIHENHQEDEWAQASQQADLSMLPPIVIESNGVSRRAKFLWEDSYDDDNESSILKQHLTEEFNAAQNRELHG